MPAVRAMWESAISPMFLALLALCAIGVVVEQLWPRYRFSGSGDRFPRIARNLALGVVYRVVALPLVLTPILVAAAHVHLWERPGFLQGWPAVVVDFLILDLLNYATHVAFHWWPALWRFHMVHHMDEHLDVTTGLRTHVAEKAINALARSVVVMAFAMPVQSVVVWQGVSFFIGLYHHNNTRVGARIERYLNWVVQTRSFHDIHHGRDVEYTNSNYAFVFTFWDRIFGTYSTDVRPAGFRNGLDHRKDKPAVSLLVTPFLPGKPFPDPGRSHRDAHDSSTESVGGA